MLLIVCRLIVYTSIAFSQAITGIGIPVSKVQKQFGKRVRELRKAKGLSQEELAFKAGIHRTYIGGIERGERNPSLNNIAAIAKALGVTPPELFASK